MTRQSVSSSSLWSPAPRFFSAFIILAAALALVALGACSKPPTPPPGAENGGASVNTAEPIPRAQAQSATDDRRPLPSAEASAAPAPPEDARLLKQRFFAAAEASERVEIADQLCALGTPEAAETARLLFYGEHDEDVKVQLLTGIVQMEEPNARERNFGLLVAALAFPQPANLRKVAIALLTDSGDNRALPVISALLNDPDPEIRESAADAVPRLQGGD